MVFSTAIKMKWAIKPKQKKLGYIYYSSTRILDKKNPEERENATLYISAEEDDLLYYVDFNGNEIKPKM